MRVPALLAIAVALILGLAACGGDGDSGSTSAEGTTTAVTTTAAGEGDAAAGQAVWDSTNCGSCHVLEAAGANGSVGPDLDDTVVRDAGAAGMSVEEFVRQSIADPDVFVAEGYQPGVMPGEYENQLSSDDFDDLVAFVSQSVQ
jgi:mono/diheme cytochrome c family protein